MHRTPIIIESIDLGDWLKRCFLLEILQIAYKKHLFSTLPNVFYSPTDFQDFADFCRKSSE